VGASCAVRSDDRRAFRGTLRVFLMTVAGCLKADIGRLARPPRRLGVGFTLLALVACAPPRVTVVPEPLQGLVPCAARVDPHLFALTEHWASGGTTGDVPVGELLRQALVDELQAPLRLTYVASQLDVATVVSPTFYRPRAYQARYQLTVRVESPAAGAGQAWLHTAGDSHTLVSAARASADAVTQAVRELCRQVGALREAVGPRAGVLRQPPMTPLDRDERMGARMPLSSFA
jgi:Lipopolysaccharide-assembly